MASDMEALRKFVATLAAAQITIYDQDSYSEGHQDACNLILDHIDWVLGGKVRPESPGVREAP